MTTITSDELAGIEGGWCVPLSPAAGLLYLLSDGGICVGISNEAN